VGLTVWFTGLSGAGKTTICKSVHAEFQAAEFQGNPRESAKRPIGQTARPEAAVRNWISAWRAADGRPFDRVQNGVSQNSLGWQIMVGW